MGFIEFLRACSANDCKTLEQYLEPSVSVVLNANIYYAMPPGFILPLPLVEAARYNARECAELLVRYGADPDLISNSRKSEKKSARQIRPEWFEDIPKKDERIAEFFH